MKSAESRIIKATFALISERPFHSITTEEIIKTAGVAKASFYYYFRDKYDVAVAVMKELIFTSIKKSENIDFTWTERLIDIQKKLVKAKTFMSNVLKIDMAHYLYLDLTRYYANCLNQHIKAAGLDVERLDVRKAIENLAQTDIMIVYQYSKGKIKDKDLVKMTEMWRMWCPHNLYDYIR